MLPDAAASADVRACLLGHNLIDSVSNAMLAPVQTNCSPKHLRYIVPGCPPAPPPPPPLPANAAAPHLLLSFVRCNLCLPPCVTPQSVSSSYDTGNTRPPFYFIPLKPLFVPATQTPPPSRLPIPHPPRNHSTSQINEHIALHPWGQPGFIDPGFRDAKLSADGAALAHFRAAAFQTEHAQFLADARLILSSPLTRALQTAELLLPPPSPGAEVPRMMLPLAAERVYLT